MKPTRVLFNEHRVIEQVLDCLEQAAQQWERDGRVETEPARQMIDFFRGYADRCHHGKEETHLFPLMEQRGFPQDAGPVAVMRVEHDQGRRFVRAMELAIDAAGDGDAGACRRFASNARDFALLLREHIDKEDHCLFPMADNAFDDSDQSALQATFERVERDEIGRDVHDSYVRLADALADRFGVAKGRVAAVSQTRADG